MSDPVLITGCARSGTSMVSGVLAASGLDFGGPLHKKRRKYQPRGFWEHLGVRQKILKPLLKDLGADPRGQRPLPVRDIRIGQDEADRLRDRVLTELDGATAYKDAKLLLLWRFFHAALPDSPWVLVRRDRKAIARSCMRTPFMKRRTYFADWLHWVDQYENRMDDLKASGAVVIEIWPDPDDVASFRPMIEALGLTFDADRVRGALVPEAWHRK